MNRWTMLILGIFTSLFAEAKDCYCGTVKDDPLFAKAVHLLYLSICHSGPDSYFPRDANEFYPPLEMQEDIDDSYPFEGRISWDYSAKGKWWDRKVLGIEFNERYRGHYSTEDSVKAPFKITRKLEWTNHPSKDRHDFEHEYQEIKIFDFKNKYRDLSQAFALLKSDISFYCTKNELFIDARIKDLSNKIDIWQSGHFGYYRTQKETLLERKQKIQLYCLENLNFTSQKEAEAFDACVKSLDYCIKKHQNPLAHVNRGLFYYLDGKAINALREIKAALEKADAEEHEEIQEEAFLLKGQSELEAGLYADAVTTLTKLIGQNPINKEAYFERAGAYFELGNFDLCLGDYLASEIKPQVIPTDSMEMISFSLGITKGILQGGGQAGIEFIPSLLSSLQGIAHGLWAFAQDPVQISIEFIQTSQACINFIRENTLPETLTQLVPELKELIENWDQLQDEKKGEITGHIIGKYGVDIFAGVGITKGMKLYRDLKRANNLMTFEAMAISKRNRELIKLECARRPMQEKKFFKTQT